MERPALFPPARHRRRLRLALVLVVLALVGSAVGVAPARAQDPAEGVDLETTLWRSGGGLPVVDLTTWISVSLDNTAPRPATGVAVQLSLPAGARLVGGSGIDCTAAG